MFTVDMLETQGNTSAFSVLCNLKPKALGACPEEGREGREPLPWAWSLRATGGVHVQHLFLHLMGGVTVA